MRNKKVAIAGIGLTKQSKSLEENNLSICIKAIEQALNDAGMQLEEIDGISGRWPGPGGTELDPGVVDWTGVFRKPFRWVGDTYPQGVPGILDAAAAVSFGLCNAAIGCLPFHLHDISTPRYHFLLMHPNYIYSELI